MFYRFARVADHRLLMLEAYFPLKTRVKLSAGIKSFFYFSERVKGMNLPENVQST